MNVQELSGNEQLREKMMNHSLLSMTKMRYKQEHIAPQGEKYVTYFFFSYVERNK